MGYLVFAFLVAINVLIQWYEWDRKTSGRALLV